LATFAQPPARIVLLLARIAQLSGRVALLLAAFAHKISSFYLLRNGFCEGFESLAVFCRVCTDKKPQGVCLVSLRLQA
jgi:hypothetical protein